MRVQVLGFKRKTGVGAKSGNAYDMGVVQCVWTDPDGSVLCGELILPKGHPDIREGVHECQLALSRGIDGKVSGRVISLVPVAK